MAGLDVRYGLDYDKNAMASFSANHPNAYGDWRDVAAVTGKEILELAQTDRIDYLLSGPNCQAVSTMGLFFDADPRNLLFVHLARLVEEFRKLGAAPRNVIIENVPGIAFQRNVSTSANSSDSSSIVATDARPTSSISLAGVFRNCVTDSSCWRR